MLCIPDSFFRSLPKDNNLVLLPTQVAEIFALTYDVLVYSSTASDAHSVLQMRKINKEPVLAAGRSSLFAHCLVGGYVRYFTVWKCASFQKMPLSIWDENAVQIKYGLRDSPPKKGDTAPL